MNRRKYNLSDNLGNVRFSFDTHTTTPTPTQQDDYYAFGYEISRGSVTSPKNEYLYNKKELQEELGQYDYGARFYDPVTGRWNVVDAYAEHPDQIDLSPYAYVGNNPITRTDPDGNCEPCDVPSDDIVQPTNPGYRMMHPDLAAIHYVAYNILDAIGVVNLVNRIGHTRDKNVSTTEKIVKVITAAVNVLAVGEEGEGEGFHGEGPKINIEELKPKGAANEKVASSIKNGKQAHADLSAKAKAKGWQANVRMTDPQTGKPIIADVVTSGGHPLEYKPKSPTGKTKGAKQLPKYERATGTNGRVIYYDPKNNGNMKSINLGEFYLTVPDHWDTEIDGNIVSLFDQHNGFGALQFSFYTVSNIDAIDLKKELQEYLLDKHNNVDVDLTNEYAYFDATIGGIYWRYWLLKTIKSIVFISYNCDLADMDKEKIAIDNIINTRSDKPPGLPK